MEAYSMDLRKRIFRAVTRPEAIHQQVADRFDVSTAFIRRLLQRYRQTGSLASKTRTVKSTAKLQEPQQEQIKAFIQEQPDATLQELCDRLEQDQKISVSDSTMSRALAKLKLRRKKRR
jgi:transposase